MRRRLFAEMLGTFAIVFFGCGAIATGGSNLGVALVFGLVVAASIYALGHISAAHFNPAVTFGFALIGRFPWRFVPAYMVAQCLGAIAASGAHALLLPDRATAIGYGASVPHVDVARCVGIEALLTFFLMLVIVSVATDRRTDGAVPRHGGSARRSATDAAMGGPLHRRVDEPRAQPGTGPLRPHDPVALPSRSPDRRGPRRPRLRGDARRR